MNDNGIVIKINDLHKTFASQKVLDGVNLEIKRGEITVIIGKSGGGKSVLMKHLIGLLKPDSGEIWIEGSDITKLNEKDLNEVRKKFGMLFQEAALFDSMNVIDNVAFPVREHTKLPEKEILRMAQERLRNVGLAGFDSKMPSELSGGMRKRVGLARALILDPDIILFDEPTSALDPITALTILDLIKETQERLQKTYVVISHDILGMFRIAHKVAMLYNGRIIEFGTPKEIRQSKKEEIKEFLKATGIPGFSGGDR
ncbi:MAG TPA: ABC transporter ATP-binding protein [Syntrophorhabdaceae bacterium]|nr:ABC transporter ATP-binding protein [Syntrophorhabdaceae bacterium]HOL06035.1 ABC transporter ATP-binding protein [Syntrophorhabdaceae bacterium]HON85137.1 ABC transporter ATP-binding protein [Syntrophorhabdaceae bacterium]HOT41261.1 ABC transporter ATP-binding protein [Syntrophorhabdaceae bacterium]HPC66068.1 ABC transporter ATP-binding protein [Syntrophorhabdaceae bacterium]